MTHAIRVHQYGGPEVLKWESVDVPAPGPGQVRIRQTAVGLNFIDTYIRTGAYPQPNLPVTLGMEGAGEVIDIGPGVKNVKRGDQVAYAGAIGSYAEERVIAADRLVKRPKGVSDQQAAAMMLQGMTARYLLRKTYKVKEGTVILFHAAAGGVGLIACQWAKHLGATVIGTAGSKEKCDMAKKHGCKHVINYREENFAERVKEITKGKGVDVVYDSIGKDTWPASLDCLKPLGLFVTFGQSSGALPAVNLAILAQKGSLFLTRPTLATYIAKREDLEETAKDLFKVVANGKVKLRVNQTFPLRDAAEAHRALEGRMTTGSTVLLP